MRNANFPSGDLSLITSSALSEATKVVATRMDARSAIVLILIGPELPSCCRNCHTLSGAARNRKLNLFRIAAINRDRFSFVIARADHDLQLPVTVQIECRDYSVSFWVKLALDQLRFHFSCDHATQ